MALQLGATIGKRYQYVEYESEESTLNCPLRDDESTIFLSNVLIIKHLPPPPTTT
ncbi:MAG: hypothetical protein LBR36_05150 [Bacteroidales bacterium]|jgi:hypothetical protein|nr:hypothetical protein [Bacteroidales bacterium]